MTVDEVLKGLDLCSTPGGGCPNECPYNKFDEYGEDCSRMLKRDAMSLIMQGEIAIKENASSNSINAANIINTLTAVIKSQQDVIYKLICNTET